MKRKKGKGSKRLNLSKETPATLDPNHLPKPMACCGLQHCFWIREKPGIS